MRLILNESQGFQGNAGEKLNQIAFAPESRICDRVLSIAETKVVHIVACTADEDIVPLIALQRVAPKATEQRIASVIARNGIVALAPKERIVARIPA